MRTRVVMLIGVVALVLSQAELRSSPLRVGITDRVRIGSMAVSGTRQETAPVCGLADADARWIQQALDGWRQTSALLHMSRAPLPQIVLFSPSCVWHLMPQDGLPAATAPIATSLSFAGSPVVVRAMPHRGTIRLPDGRDIPAQPVAMASVYREGAAAFFVMALPDVWRRDDRYARDPHLDKFFLGVMMHEMVHTQHLPGIVERAKELAGRYELPSLQLDDDIIQKRFERVRGFRKAFEAERDLFFRAAAESDARRRRALTVQGLSMARQRRARYFSGAERMYADFEDLFLGMEGAAQWAAYRFAKAQAGSGSSDAATLAFVRANRKYWSQEEGLALFLLLDAMVPRWQERVFGPALASPFALLEEAVKPRAS